MAIYLIRHGIDDEGFRGGWSQRGLIVEGLRQSEKAGIYLKEHQSEYNINRIISSDLQRAMDTAGEIARVLDLPVETSGLWREMNNGAIAGLPHDIANERYPGVYFSSLRMDERFPGGESPQEFYTRISGAFEALCKEHLNALVENNTLVVTHGGVINIIYHILKGLEWSNKSAKFSSSYTAIHKIVHREGTWVAELENHAVHIGPSG